MDLPVGGAIRKQCYEWWHMGYIQVVPAVGYKARDTGGAVYGSGGGGENKMR